MRSIGLLMHDEESGKMHQLHGPTTQLDATFDIIYGTMGLQQKMRDPKTWPEAPEAQSKVKVQFDTANSTLVNLEGLADNSLLFTFKLLWADPTKTKTKQKPRSKLMLCQEIMGFLPEDQTTQCPLLKALNKNTNKDKTLQLHLPENRINPWLTAALILLTFREINPAIWHRITTQQKAKDVAGLNWVQIREKTGPISTTLSLEARKKYQLAYNKEMERWAAIERQAIHLGLQGDSKQGYVGFSAMMNKPAKRCRLRAGDLGFRG
jgi:hypothetical protein